MKQPKQSQPLPKPMLFIKTLLLWPSILSWLLCFAGYKRTKQLNVLWSDSQYNCSNGDRRIPRRPTAQNKTQTEYMCKIKFYNSQSCGLSDCEAMLWCVETPMFRRTLAASIFITWSHKKWSYFSVFRASELTFFYFSFIPAFLIPSLLVSTIQVLWNDSLWIRHAPLTTRLTAKGHRPIPWKRDIEISCWNSYK
jgi:hypothetical protein